jgi:hypothetical protein
MIKRRGFRRRWLWPIGGTVPALASEKLRKITENIPEYSMYRSGYEPDISQI